MKISAILQQWYDTNHRDLPWRHTSDAYLIWLSEIILQQTRVVQGLDYYRRFVEAYPSVDLLAAAAEDDVLKLWQGLGYYSRARNLHKAARMVVELFDGTFPTRYADLIRLPGVGPYTASAIASFSSGEAVATVDGNVYRVLARLFDIETPIDSTQGQQLFAALAQQELDPRHAARHNQAMMEFGALLCTPLSPQCDVCPLADLCLALEHHSQGLRPVKAGKVKVRARNLNYYIIKEGDRLWVHQRGANDIWQGLWEFYCMEGKEAKPPVGGHIIAEFSVRHQLTHQTLHCHFALIIPSHTIDLSAEGYQSINWEDWQKKAVPKPIFDINAKISSLFGKN